MDEEALAKKVAEYANTCCYRSDGFEEDVLKVAREAIAEAVAAEREACAKVCDARAKRPNDGNWTAEEWETICGANELAAADIRARSNANYPGGAR